MNVFTKTDQIKLFLYQSDISNAESLYSDLYDLFSTINHKKVVLKIEDVDNLSIKSLVAILSFIKAVKTSDKMVFISCTPSLESMFMELNMGSFVDSIER